MLHLGDFLITEGRLSIATQIECVFGALGAGRRVNAHGAHLKRCLDRMSEEGRPSEGEHRMHPAPC